MAGTNRDLACDDPKAGTNLHSCFTHACCTQLAHIASLTSTTEWKAITSALRIDLPRIKTSQRNCLARNHVAKIIDNNCDGSPQCDPGTWCYRIWLLVIWRLTCS